MTRNAIITPLVALAMSLAATAVVAQDAASQPQPTATQTDQAAPAKTAWEDLDSNKDGNLSKQETTTVPALHDVFDKADSNADGVLTGDEYRTYLAANNAESGKPMQDKKK
jgi:Ca2+-binding EF-hand superfamily protein